MRAPRTALSHEQQYINLARKLHYFYSWIQYDGKSPNTEMVPLSTGQRIGKVSNRKQMPHLSQVAPKKCYAIFTKIAKLFLLGE